jgi:hypothetical protein
MSDDFLILWDAFAFEVIRRLALTERAFSTDAVWAVLDTLPKPADPRALGPVLLRARKEGLIAKSDLVVNSTRKACHSRPTAIWLSQPLNGTLNDAAAYVAKQKAVVSMPVFDFADSRNEVTS